MKCPKCGYNSFEYYDVCKKCSNDLIAYKQTYGISAIILPQEAQEQLAAEFRAAVEVDAHHAESAETHDDMFSFDLSDETATSASTLHSDDPFSFDDHPAAPGNQQAQAEDDVFADLLESTSQVPSSSSPRSAPQGSAAASGPGEFDLENFSWDEPSATVSDGTQAAADDFDALFGDAKETAPK